jgi:hypothetical protein
VPQEPHRDEGKSAAPWFSPGLVRSNEVILRTILDPDHLEPGGKLAVAAISLQDIRHRGWSVDRKNYTSLRRVKSSHSKWKRNKPSIVKCYVLPIPVGEIRHLDPITGVQDFVVTDAALWLNPAHAVILLSGPQGQSAARGFRNNLLQKLPNYVDVAEAFAPSDKYGYFKGMLGQFAAMLVSLFRSIFR